MKKTLIALIAIVVIVLCGVSAYAIQGLDESKSTTILATDGYATLTTSTVGGTVNTTITALQEVVDNTAYEGLHVTDTNCVISMDKAFIKSLLEEVSGTVVSFHFGYDGTKTVVTFEIKDGDDNLLFGKAGRCVGILPHEATSPSAVSDFIMVDGANKKIVLTAYFAEAKEIHWQLNGSGSYTIANNHVSFNDTKGHWAEEYIDFLTARGVIDGMTPTTFEPGGTLTRAQFVKMLSMLVTDDCSSYTVDHFSDVKEGAWYYYYVAWAYQCDVVNGTSETTFSPESKITRQEMAMMMKNLFGYLKIPTTPVRSELMFTDKDNISDWAKTAVTEIQRTGLLDGYDDGRFLPLGTATRAEAATTCSRIIAYCMILPQ